MRPGRRFPACRHPGFTLDADDAHATNPNAVPTAIDDVRSGKVVGPDGVVYSVENSGYVGDEGWKEMLAPAG